MKSNKPQPFIKLKKSIMQSCSCTSQTDTSIGNYYENDILQKKDTFLKIVSNMCWVLAGWKNKYRSKYNCFSDANAGMEYTATSTSKHSKGKNKRT